ncbi:c-type cytochrome [Abyssicoccus albus]|uniref:Cytochrome c550 n=1 Tax=Abyssicoccus albus TaxID=1817405 RepID=A0A3N5CDA2_9BACL|nr:cytochrome c [Abyssicoccus albus]RPF58122.1 cytochrome c550 [Abyssicoccus albus]
MNRNPIIPFLLIMLLGVGLIFFMSSIGANQPEGGEGEEAGQEQAEGGGGEFDAASFAKDNCASCHGQDLSGGMGPALAGNSKDDAELKKIIREGKGSMPSFDESKIADKDLDALIKHFKEM